MHIYTHTSRYIGVAKNSFALPIRLISYIALLYEHIVGGERRYRARLYKQQFEGNRLQNFITEEIPFVISIRYPFNDEMVADTCEALDAEADNIKYRLKNAHYKLDSYQLEKYVQCHQDTLMELAGKLLDHTNPQTLTTDTRTTGTNAICRHVYGILQDLLGFMETNLSSYYNNEVWLVPGYRKIHAYQFQNQQTTFHHVLTHYKIDEYLINIVSAPIHALIHDRSGNTATWNTVSWLHELQEHILKFAPTFGEANETLYNLLLSLNFNSRDYYQYITSRLTQTLLHLDDDAARLNRVYDELHTITQYTTTHAPLYKDLPSLTNMLRNWLDDQAALFERKLKFRTAVSTEPDQMIYPTSNPAKLPLPVAAKIIAYWISLIMRAYNIDILQKEIAQLIVNLFTSKRTGTAGMAEHSLRNAISQPESQTIDAVEAQVSKIARFIRDDKRKPKKPDRLSKSPQNFFQLFLSSFSTNNQYVTPTFTTLSPPFTTVLPVVVWRALSPSF